MKNNQKWHKPSTVCVSVKHGIDLIDERGDLYYFPRPLVELGIDTAEKWFALCEKYKIKKWRFRQ